MATRWRPDTCGCVVEYSNDDGSHINTVEVCPKHTGLDGPALLDELRNHNRQKNYIVKELVDQGFSPEDVEVRYDPDAKRDDDPVVIKGLSRAMSRKALRVSGRAMRSDDVTSRLDQGFKGRYRIVE